MTGPLRWNMSFRRSPDFRNLLEVKPNQLQPLLRNRHPQKATDLQHMVVDEGPVAREEVGEEDIVEREVEEDMVEEVAVAHTVAGETANSEDAEKATVAGGMASGEAEVKGSVDEETDMRVIVGGETDTRVTVDEKGMKVTADEKGMMVTVDEGTDMRVIVDGETGMRVIVVGGGDEAKDVVDLPLNHNRNRMAAGSIFWVGWDIKNAKRLLPCMILAG